MLRLLAHAEAFGRARAELKAATAAYKSSPTEKAKRRLEGALAFHRKAEHRFTRTTWRVRTEFERVEAGW